MCGIVGYYHLNLASDERLPLLRRMCQTIAHRGPDDEGYFSDQLVGLGMRRLSIIDLNTGRQPISCPKGTKHIVFNGEIYNYRELRETLQQSGYPFSTQSDTETILAQYIQDGARCLHQLNGMFAIAIWDSETQTLFLARDRMGVKPLYYYWDGHHFLFASEIKALLVAGYAAKAINTQAVWDYLTFRYVPQPETIWQNIHKLPPGHSLLLSPEHPEPQIQRYWDIPYSDDFLPKSELEYQAEFDNLFLSAVERRLIADVPVGILLSGGLDSSAVAAAVAETHNARLDSFSVAFANSPHINELAYARMVSNYVGTNHHEIIIGQEDFLSFLPQFVHFTDEPLADLASIPLYYVSHLARQKVKVVLSGEGSDEILAGYNFEQLVHYWERQQAYQKLPPWLRHNNYLMNLWRKLNGKNFERRYAIDDAPLDLRLRAHLPHMTNYLDTQAKRALMIVQENFRDSQAVLRQDIQRVKSQNPLHQMLYLYCQSWLVEDLLMKADRMTMATSLELRVPFLDYRLVEWAARTPASLKAGRDSNGQYTSKIVLRQFAKNRLPETVINRPKMGFPVPVYDWLSDQLKPWAYDLLGSPQASIYQWLDFNLVQPELATATSPNADSMTRQRVWNLLILELWCNAWMKT